MSEDLTHTQKKGPFLCRGMCSYLCLQVKGHHGETKVQQEVLLLEALEGATHTERHHVGPLDEQRGAEDVDRAQTHDAHKPDLPHKHTADSAL